MSSLFGSGQPRAGQEEERGVFERARPHLARFLPPLLRPSASEPATALPPIKLLTERGSPIYLDVLIAERGEHAAVYGGRAQSGWLSLHAGMEGPPSVGSGRESREPRNNDRVCVRQRHPFVAMLRTTRNHSVVRMGRHMHLNSSIAYNYKQT